MKKLSSIFAGLLLFAVSSFAATDPEPANKKLNEAFAKHFSSAQSVTWNQAAMITTASFTLDGAYLSAHFSPDAKMLGVSRNIAVSDLPIKLTMGLKSYLNKYWITSIFEYATPAADTYYVTVENADSKVILKSEGGEFEIFKKTGK